MQTEKETKKPTSYLCTLLSREFIKFDLKDICKKSECSMKIGQVSLDIQNMLKCFGM